MGYGGFFQSHCAGLAFFLIRPPLLVGVLGCMAERLKSRLLDSKRLADLVVGPDAYRDLPRILAAVHVSVSVK